MEAVQGKEGAAAASDDANPRKLALKKFLEGHPDVKAKMVKVGARSPPPSSLRFSQLCIAPWRRREGGRRGGRGTREAGRDAGGDGGGGSRRRRSLWRSTGTPPT